MTPENIKTSHASFHYNSLIAEVLYRSSFLESWGSGVGRMVDTCRAQGLPEPEYEIRNGFVTIVFRRSKVMGDVNDPVNDPANDLVNTLPQTAQRVYAIIKGNEGIRLSLIHI